MSAHTLKFLQQFWEVISPEEEMGIKVQKLSNSMLRTTSWHPKLELEVYLIANHVLPNTTPNKGNVFTVASRQT